MMHKLFLLSVMFSSAFALSCYECRKRVDSEGNIIPLQGKEQSCDDFRASDEYNKRNFYQQCPFGYKACLQQIVINYKGESSENYSCFEKDEDSSPFHLEMGNCTRLSHKFGTGNNNNLPTGRMCICDTDYCLVDGGISLNKSGGAKNGNFICGVIFCAWLISKLV